MSNLKKQLGEFIDQRKREKELQEQERRRRNDEDRTKVLEGVGGDLTKGLAPVLQKLAESAKTDANALREAFSDSFNIQVPPIDASGVEHAALSISESATRIEKAVQSMNAREPVVNVPAPIVNVPEQNIQFPSRFDVNMPEVDRERPLPVMMMDTQGRPLAFPAGWSGGKADFLTIKDIRTSSGASLIDQVEGALKITGNLTASLSASTTVSLINRDGDFYNGDNPLPVDIFDAFGSTAVGSVFNADNRLRVSVETGGSGLTDSELRASAIFVEQVSGSAWSVFTQPLNTFGADGLSNEVVRTGLGLSNGSTWDRARNTAGEGNALRVQMANDAIASVNVRDVFATTATSTVVNPDNRVRIELPATTITAVTSITNTVATANVDSTGVQYSGSNPLPITIISGALTSTVVVGDTLHDAADIGAAPIKVGGVAMTTNPTAVSDGDRVNFRADDLGRQITRPVQVRDLIQTAYVSLTNGTETTLLAASAGNFQDLIMIVGSNVSDAAVTVDLRAVTGGNIINSLRIPANGTAGWTPPVPWPQDATGNNWTVDGPDETGRTIYLSALFSRES